MAVAQRGDDHPFTLVMQLYTPLTDNPAPSPKAEILNARRLLSSGLNYGRRIKSEMQELQRRNGVTPERSATLPSAGA